MAVELIEMIVIYILRSLPHVTLSGPSLEMLSCGGAISQFANRWVRLLGVAFYCHIHILLVERLNFPSIEKPLEFYVPLPFHILGL